MSPVPICDGSPHAMRVAEGIYPLIPKTGLTLQPGGHLSVVFAVSCPFRPMGFRIPKDAVPRTVSSLATLIGSCRNILVESLLAGTLEQLADCVPLLVLLEAPEPLLLETMVPGNINKLRLRNVGTKPATLFLELCGIIPEGAVLIAKPRYGLEAASRNDIIVSVAEEGT